MSTFEMNNKAKRYFEILSEIETLEKEKKALQAVFQDIMADTGNFVINGDGWRATLAETNTSRFDTAEFKKMHKELYNAFCKIVSGTRFTLNHIKS